jgi:hypothetical protein
VADVGARGASGIVYAAAGVCTASALSLFFMSLMELFRPNKFKLKIGRLLFGSVVAIAVISYVTQYPRTFLNIAPYVNVNAHKWGFSIAFVTTLLVFLFHSFKKIRKGETIFVTQATERASILNR